MDVVVTGGQFVLHLSREEIGVVRNCVEETLENVDEAEFVTRMGATRAEVLLLGDALGDAIGRDVDQT